MIALTLPWPPTLNHMYGQRRNGGRFLKAGGVAYKQAVAEIVGEAGHETLTEPVSVFIVAYMPDKRRRDIMNLEKISSDALTDAGVWLDDSQIYDYHIVKHPDIVPGGMLKVVIRNFEYVETK